jgi:CRP-like cAMP-binding protein
MDATAESIKHSALGSDLSDEEASVLSGVMNSRQLEDGDFLIEEGTVDDTLHVLLAGKLEVVKKTGAGETASLSILRDGALAGEMSFVDSSAHTVGLRALCDCQILSLKREDFEKLVDDNPRLVYKVMRAITRSAHGIVQRMNHEFIEVSNYIFKQHGRY